MKKEVKMKRPIDTDYPYLEKDVYLDKIDLPELNSRTSLCEENDTSDSEKTEYESDADLTLEAETSRYVLIKLCCNVQGSESNNNKNEVIEILIDDCNPLNANCPSKCFNISDIYENLFSARIDKKHEYYGQYSANIHTMYGTLEQKFLWSKYNSCPFEGIYYNKSTSIINKFNHTLLLSPSEFVSSDDISMIRLKYLFENKKTLKMVYLYKNTPYENIYPKESVKEIVEYLSSIVTNNFSTDLLKRVLHPYSDVLKAKSKSQNNSVDVPESEKENTVHNVTLCTKQNYSSLIWAFFHSYNFLYKEHNTDTISVCKILHDKTLSEKPDPERIESYSCMFQDAVFDGYKENIEHLQPKYVEKYLKDMSKTDNEVNVNKTSSDLLKSSILCIDADEDILSVFKEDLSDLHNELNNITDLILPRIMDVCEDYSNSVKCEVVDQSELIITPILNTLSKKHTVNKGSIQSLTVDKEHELNSSNLVTNNTTKNAAGSSSDSKLNCELSDDSDIYNDFISNVHKSVNFVRADDVVSDNAVLPLMNFELFEIKSRNSVDEHDVMKPYEKLRDNKVLDFNQSEPFCKSDVTKATLSSLRIVDKNGIEQSDMPKTELKLDFIKDHNISQSNKMYLKMFTDQLLTTKQKWVENKSLVNLDWVNSLLVYEIAQHISKISVMILSETKHMLNAHNQERPVIYFNSLPSKESEFNHITKALGTKIRQSCISKIANYKKYFLNDLIINKNSSSNVNHLLESEKGADVNTVSKSLKSHLRLLQHHIDSDATDSSSADESKETKMEKRKQIEDLYQSDCEQSLPIVQQVNHQMSEKRALDGKKVTWLQAQILDLDLKIRTHVDIAAGLKGSRNVVKIADQAEPLMLNSDPSVINNRRVYKKVSNIDEDKKMILKFVKFESCSRTKPFMSMVFKRRPLVMTNDLHLVTNNWGKEITRASTLRCSCLWPQFWPCFVCTGRSKHTAYRMITNKSVCHPISSLDMSYHEHLSDFRKDASMVNQFEGFMKMTKWQQKMIRSGPKNAFRGRPLKPQRTIISENDTRDFFPQQDELPQVPPELSKKHIKIYNTEDNSFNKRGRKPKKFGLLPHNKRRKLSSMNSFTSNRDDGMDNIHTLKDGKWDRSCFDIYQKRRHNSFDIDDIIIPQNIARSTRIQIVKYKDIAVPKYRKLQFLNISRPNDAIADSPSSQYEKRLRSFTNICLEDEWTVDRMQQCHSLLAIEERRKNNAFEFPLTRNRNYRRLDYRAESNSSPNTPDQSLSPARTNQDSYEESFSPASQDVDFEMKSIDRFNIERRRTISTHSRSNKDLRDESRSSTPDKTDIPIFPYDKRQFMLSEHMMSRMMSAMPEGHPMFEDIQDFIKQQTKLLAQNSHSKNVIIELAQDHIASSDYQLESDFNTYYNDVSPRLVQDEIILSPEYEINMSDLCDLSTRSKDTSASKMESSDIVVNAKVTPLSTSNDQKVANDCQTDNTPLITSKLNKDGNGIKLLTSLNKSSNTVQSGTELHKNSDKSNLDKVQTSASEKLSMMSQGNIRKELIIKLTNQMIKGKSALVSIASVDTKEK